MPTRKERALAICDDIIANNPAGSDPRRLAQVVKGLVLHVTSIMEDPEPDA